MTTQEMRREELVPLLTTSAGADRITARIAPLELDQILREEQRQSRQMAAVVPPPEAIEAVDAIDFDELRTAIAPVRRSPEALVQTATMRTIPDRKRRALTRLAVIAISFAATLGLGLGVLVLA
jgi:hypothetical protein